MVEEDDLEFKLKLNTVISSLKDTLKENNLLNEKQLKDLKDVYSVFAEFDEVEESPDDETKEVTENESE